MNATLAHRYAEELSALLGKDGFEAAFARVTEDREVKQDEAIAIASELLETKIAPSTARSAALARIAKLHNSLVTFKLKQRAVGGRSAA